MSACLRRRLRSLARPGPRVGWLCEGPHNRRRGAARGRIGEACSAAALSLLGAGKIGGGVGVASAAAASASAEGMLAEDFAPPFDRALALLARSPLALEVA